MNREDIDILEVGNAYTALFYKKNYYTPYIVAWHFDPDSYTWDQGHYFESLKEQRNSLQSKKRQTQIANIAKSWIALIGIASDACLVNVVAWVFVRTLSKGEWVWQK